MIRVAMVQKVVVYSAAQGLNKGLESVDFRFQLLTVASPKSRLAFLLILANAAIASTPATCRLDLIFEVLEELAKRQNGYVPHLTFLRLHNSQLSR
jgi:hypothetical protein